MNSVRKNIIIIVLIAGFFVGKYSFAGGFEEWLIGIARETLQSGGQELSLFESCSSQLTIDGLIASCVKEDKEFLEGRKILYYYFNKEDLVFNVPIDGEKHTFRPVTLSESEISIAENLIRRVDNIIDLDFKRVSRIKSADILIYLLCEPDYQSDYGLVTTNFENTKAVLLLNECTTVSGTDERLDYKFLHEFGLVLGLEHPFDSSDGDCIFTTEKFTGKSAHLGQTLMAYQIPSNKKIPSFYTSLDIKALIQIWGRE